MLHTRHTVVAAPIYVSVCAKLAIVRFWIITQMLQWLSVTYNF